MKKVLKILIPVLFILGFGIFLLQWCKVDKIDIVSDDSQEFDQAVVTEVITDNLQEDGSRMGNQEVNVRFLTGKRKGQEVEAVSTNGNLYGATCYVGMKVITLILAFAGGSLSELMLDYTYDLPYLQLINSYTIGIEVMQSVAGSIGIILTVPLVSLFAAVLVKGE